MSVQRACVLYDRICIGCGECDRCDLDPTKICDNCMACMKENHDYRGILIDGIQMSESQDSSPSGN